MSAAGTLPAIGAPPPRPRAPLVEALPFLALALVAHLAAFALTEPGSSARGGGDGDAAVSLEGAAPSMAALVAQWDAPPRISEPAVPEAASQPQTDDLPDAPPITPPATLPDLAAPALPSPDSAPPAMPPPQAPPSMAPAPEIPASPNATGTAPETLQAPALPPSPQAPLGLAPLAAPPDARQEDPIDSAPPPPAIALSGELAPERSIVPPARPQPRSDTARAPQAPQPATPRQQSQPRAQPTAPAASAPSASAPSTRAAGNGAQEREGREGQAQSSSRAQADSAALVAQWGGQIRAAVQRQQRHPGGRRVGGTVRLQLSVDSSGRLESVRVVQGSGHAALDRAALEAAQRARLPAAPRGLNAGSYRFALPVTFRG